MKPNYLLHLDFQSIRLFHREESGIWRLVGRVAPDDHALDEAMQALVGRAKAKVGAPMHAVISLPHDLVFVTKVQTDPEVGWVRRQVDIRTELEAALSDPIEEVMFDTQTEGAETTAVVVHRDTITEADAFAKAHGIEPLAFISMPRDADGFHRPPVFAQTALGGEYAGEDGVLAIDVPGTASLRGSTAPPQRTAQISRVQPAAQPQDTAPEAAAEALPQDNADAADADADSDAVTEPAHDADDADDAVVVVAEAEAEAVKPPEADKPQSPPHPPQGAEDGDAPAALAVPAAPTAPPAAVRKVVVDPFDKIAHPFVERPQDVWWQSASRLLAPIAAVLAVVAVIGGIAYFVLPPDEEPVAVAAGPADGPAVTETATPTPQGSDGTRPAPSAENEAEPRDPLTSPGAVDAPDAPVQEPSADPTPEPTVREPSPVAPLTIPEDPTEPVELAALPIAEADAVAQPAPIGLPLDSPTHGALASPDAAVSPAIQASPAGVLARRIGEAQGSAPVPLYDLLEPTLDAQALAEVAARRPETRPADLYPVASDGTILPPEFEGVETFRPSARPAALSQAAPAETAPAEPAPAEAVTPPEAEEEAQAPRINPTPLPDAVQDAQEIRPVARQAALLDAAPVTPEAETAQATPSDTAAAVSEATPAELAEVAAIRPEARLGDSAANASLARALVAPSDPAILALADARPNARIAGLSAPAEEEPEAEAEADGRIEVAFTALRPELRPRNLQRPAQNNISRGSTPAVTAQPTPQETQPQPAAAQPTPRRGRSNLVLIGTAGTATSRRALVQVPGRGVTSVSVGDRLDGGRVAAIDMTSLVYTRNGRTIRLDMPE